MESLRNRTGVKEVTEFGGIIDPQSQQTIFANLQAEPGDHISVLGMLTCTNDAIAIGTAIITDDEESPAFGSGVVYDAGTELNEETRRTVPCLGDEEHKVSQPDTADGEGRINPTQASKSSAIWAQSSVGTVPLWNLLSIAEVSHQGEHLTSVPHCRILPRRNRSRRP